MTVLISYKVVQILILVAFLVFISDIRKKEGMRPLLNSNLNLVAKVFYLGALGFYGYMVTTLERLIFFDFVAIGLALLGMLVIVKAKRDLGRFHTWAGYFKENTRLVVEGIYAYIRHPVYTGIYIFIFGMLTMLIPRTGGFSTLGVAIISACGMAFLVIVARRETKLLIKELGEEFLAYQRQVHAFLPLRKYKV